MEEIGHDGPSLSFDFKFPFQNKSILITLNMINEMTNQLRQQMKNKMQVRVQIDLDLDINLQCKL